MIAPLVVVVVEHKHINTADGLVNEARRVHDGLRVSRIKLERADGVVVMASQTPRRVAGMNVITVRQEDVVWSSTRRPGGYGWAIRQTESACNGVADARAGI